MGNATIQCQLHGYEYSRCAPSAREITLTNDIREAGFNSFKRGLKRLSRGWQMNASFSATHRHIPYINGLDPTEQGSSVQLADLDPNAQFLGADETWEKTGKLAGSYAFPYGLLASANYEFRSGEPWARQVQFRGGTTIPTQVLRVEEIGARRLPDRTLVNLRVQKSLRFGKGTRLDLRANIFNVFNAKRMQVTKRRAAFLVPIPDATFPAIVEPPSRAQRGVRLRGRETPTNDRKRVLVRSHRTGPSSRLGSAPIFRVL